MTLSADPSNLVQSGFILIALILACWWIWVTGKAYAGYYNQSATNKVVTGFHAKAAIWATLIACCWLGLTALISFQEWAHQFDSFPPPGVRVVIILVIITSLIAFLKPGKIIMQQTPIYLIIGFQAFRFPLELLIHQVYAENITIVEMTFQGRNFDIVTGLLALLLGIYAFKNELSHRIILLWNLLGLALLINVVATGILSMPHPMQMIQTDFPNIWVTYFPFIWLPGVMVCSALFGHLLVFRYLASQKKSPVLLKAPQEN